MRIGNGVRWELIHGTKEEVEERLNELQERSVLLRPCGAPVVAAGDTWRFDRLQPGPIFAILVSYDAEC